MSDIIASAGWLVIRKLDSGLTALDFTGGGGTYVTLTPDRWRDLVNAVKEAGRQ